MMTKATMTKKLKPRIEKDHILLDYRPKYNDKKKLKSFTKITVKISDFHTMFKDNFDTYAKAVDHDKKKGWGYKKYFEEWKKEGIWK